MIFASAILSSPPLRWTRGFVFNPPGGSKSCPGWPRSACLTAGLILGFTTSALQGAIRAFPGAEGAGAYATGGRGGGVYHVTNLADEDGGGNAIPGSLRFGINSATGPRTIVFDVAGNIELTGKLNVKKPNITIAGQTAPGGGICIKNYHLSLEANDLILRHLRVRTGYGPNNGNTTDDSLQIGSGTNIIVDHVSTSFGGDENLSATRQCFNVTVQWCVISESLNYASHAYGSLIAPELSGTRISWHHNLYANNLGRTPRAGSRLFATNFVFDYVNNGNYNWGTSGDWGGWAVVGGNPNEEAVDFNFIGNYSIAGPNTTTTTAQRAALSSNFATSRIYQFGNLIDTNRNTIRDGANTGFGMIRGTYTQMASPFPIAASNAITTTDAVTAYYQVLSGAGANLVRDTSDLRAVNNVRYQTGSIITTNTQVGGWPTLAPGTGPKDSDGDGMADYWELAVGLSTNTPDGNLDLNGDGYTELEAYLNWLAGPHAVVNVNGMLDVDLRAMNGSSGTNLVFTVADPTNGTVSMLGDGYTARFLPDPDFTGLTSFAFTATEFAAGINLWTNTVGIVITGPNTPPAVTPLADRTIIAGSTLVSSFAATDKDQPPQTFTFSLSDPPPGASIAPGTSVLTWRPPMSHIGTNYLGIVVTDSGSPGLSGTQNYTVIVNRPALPGLQGAGFTNGRFTMVITGPRNPDYMVQASTNLDDPGSWATLFTTNAPITPFRWIESSVSNLPQRYYRVMLGP